MNDVTIQVNGVSVCYDDVGNGLIPLIFIHGFPFDKSSWLPQLEFFKTTNRVIAYDIRGFGKSASGNEKASMDLFADDLVKLMDSLQINKAIACGLSMGGYILLNAVNRYPERFEGIILSDTQCIADSAEGKEKRYKTIQQIEAGGLNDFAEGFLKNIFYDDTFIDKKEVVEKIRKIVLSTAPSSITGTLEALAQRADTCLTLEKIMVPVLILCGKEDKITPLAQSEFMLGKIKTATLRSIDKAGHLSNLEQAGEFNNHLHNFILSLSN